MGRLKNLGDQLGHSDAGNDGGRARRFGFRREIARGPYVESRLRLGLDPSLVLQNHVGLEHGGNAHVHLGAQFPYRWEALAGVQRALIDQLGDVIRHPVVEQLFVSVFLFQHGPSLALPSSFRQTQPPRITISTVGIIYNCYGHNFK